MKRRQCFTAFFVQIDWSFCRFLSIWIFLPKTGWWQMEIIFTRSHSLRGCVWISCNAYFKRFVILVLSYSNSFLDMWALGTIIMITGATSGWLNSGITSLFLTTWGPEKSRPYIASFHFTFSIGAILAPFLVGLYKDCLHHCIWWNFVFIVVGFTHCKVLSKSIKAR